MYNQNLDVFRTVLEGLRGDELNVVVTVGNQNDPAASGRSRPTSRFTHSSHRIWCSPSAPLP